MNSAPCHQMELGALRRRITSAAIRRFVARARRSLPRDGPEEIFLVRRLVARLARQERRLRTMRSLNFKDPDGHHIQILLDRRNTPGGARLWEGRWYGPLSARENPPPKVSPPIPILAIPASDPDFLPEDPVDLGSQLGEAGEFRHQHLGQIVRRARGVSAQGNHAAAGVDPIPGFPGANDPADFR
jgi:hypothetical protein